MKNQFSHQELFKKLNEILKDDYVNKISFYDNYVAILTEKSKALILNKNYEIIFEKNFEFKIFDIKISHNILILRSLRKVLKFFIQEKYSEIYNFKEMVYDLIIIQEKVYVCTSNALFLIENTEIKNLEYYANIFGIFMCKLFYFNNEIFCVRATSNGKIFINKNEIENVNIKCIIFDVYLKKYHEDIIMVISSENRQLIYGKIEKNKLKVLQTNFRLKERFLRCGIFNAKYFYGITDKHNIFLINKIESRFIFKAPNPILQIFFIEQTNSTIIITEREVYLAHKIQENQTNIKISKALKYQKRNEIINEILFKSFKINSDFKMKDIDLTIKSNGICYYIKDTSLYSNIQEEKIYEFGKKVKFLFKLNEICFLIITVENEVYLKKEKIIFLCKIQSDISSYSEGIFTTKKNEIFYFDTFSKQISVTYNRELLNNIKGNIMQSQIINNEIILIAFENLFFFHEIITKKTFKFLLNRKIRGFFVSKKIKKNFLETIFLYGFVNKEIFITNLTTKESLNYAYEGHYSDFSYQNFKLTFYDFVAQKKIEFLNIENLIGLKIIGEFLIYPFNLCNKKNNKIQKENNSIVFSSEKSFFKQPLNVVIYAFNMTKKYLILALKNKELLVFSLEDKIINFVHSIKLPVLVKSLCIIENKNHSIFLGFVNGKILKTNLDYILSQKEIVPALIDDLKIYNLCFLGKIDEKCIIFTNNGFLIFEESEEHFKLHKNSIRDYKINNNLLYTLGDDQTIATFNLKEKKIIKRIFHHFPIKRIYEKIFE